MKKHVFSATFLATATLCAAPAHAVEIIDIGPVSGSSSGYGVNNFGQVTGTMRATGGPLESFFWDPVAGLQPLSTFGFDRSYANAINGQGRVVGYVQNGIAPGYPYLWDPIDGMQMLGAATGGANGINNDSWVTGYSHNGSYNEAFIWKPDGSMQPLGTLGGTYSRGEDINAHGHVVGAAKNLASRNEAFIWQNGVMTGLGYLEGDTSRALAINDLNQIVGVGSTYENGTGAFYWDADGGMQRLDVFGVTQVAAIDINNVGQIVGGGVSHSGEDFGYLFQDGVAIDLNDLLPDGSLWNVGGAYAINDVGQVVGWGSYGGEGRAFLMTIPAPGTATILLAALGFRRRRRM